MTTVPQHRRGFTIPEVLAVVAIFVILIAMLLPSMLKAKKSANIAICSNNLHQLYTAFQANKTDSKFGSARRGPLSQAFLWQSKLLPYMQNETAMTICPEDDKLGLGLGQDASTQLYLEVWTGKPGASTQLHNMDFEVGTFTRRVDKSMTDAEIDADWSASANAIAARPLIKSLRDQLSDTSYLLCFEDLRPDGGDKDYEDFVFRVDEDEYGVLITFVHDGGSYHASLKERGGGVIWNDVDQHGDQRVGASVPVDGSPSSYGMNAALSQILKRPANAIFMLDYERSVADGGYGAIDPWNDWHTKQGVPRFSRHQDRTNIIFFDGGVELMDPANFDPKIREYKEKYWVPPHILD